MVFPEIKARYTGAIFVFALFAACSRQEPDTRALGGDRLQTVEAVMRGARLYQEHCAQCHGPEAQGHPDWSNPQVVAAPPLNGSGNDWRRKKSELVAVIKHGAKRGNEPVMPGWSGRLSDRDVEDIIAWFQALWPMEIYDQWLKANTAAPGPKG
jgi:mono/diheme cytochrome c family protein